MTKYKLQEDGLVWTISHNRITRWICQYSKLKDKQKTAAKMTSYSAFSKDYNNAQLEINKIQQKCLVWTGATIAESTNGVFLLDSNLYNSEEVEA